MKILYFPSDRGGGFGHISRCLALAREAEIRGHRCRFVLSDHKFERRIDAQFPVLWVKPRAPFLPKVMQAMGKKVGTVLGKPPIYLAISGLDYQVIRDGLVSVQAAERLLEEYHKAANSFKPDLLIGDTNLLLWILAGKLNLPLVQIVRYASHPATGRLIWWQATPEGMVPPDSAALFNPILEEARLAGIRKAEDLLRGDLYLVPSIESLEPIDHDEKTVFVGELSQDAGADEKPPWLDEMEGNRPLIYVTIGGGAGPVGNASLFRAVNKAFSQKKVNVVVSTGGKFNREVLGPPAENVKGYDWLPGRLLIRKADLVIFHGGYGTMMECVASGKPSLILPFHTEQEGNGRRLEQQKCGRVLPLSKQEYQRIDRKWRYGRFSYLVQNRLDLTAEELAWNAEKILADGTYRENARYLKGKVEEHGGAVRALDVIEQKFQ